MAWKPNGILICDGQGGKCRGAFDIAADPLPPRVEVIYRARVAGWHIYSGPNFTNTRKLEQHLCPNCVTNGTVRTPPPKILEGQQSLFEEESDVSRLD